MNYAASAINVLAGKGGPGFRKLVQISPTITTSEEDEDEHQNYLHIDDSDDAEVRGLDDRTLYARANNNVNQHENESNNSWCYVNTKRVLSIKDDEIYTSCSELEECEIEKEEFINNEDAVQRKREKIRKYLQSNINSSNINSSNVPIDDEHDFSYTQEAEISKLNFSESTLVSDFPSEQERIILGPERRQRRRRRANSNSNLKCFGCMFGSPEQDPIHGKKMNTLLKIFEENYGKTSNLMLARMCHVYFKRHIYIPMKSAGKDIPIWRTKDIQKHFEEHVAEPRIYIGESIKKYKLLSRALHDQLFRQVPSEETGLPVIIADRNNIRNALLVDKMLNQFYQMRSENMNFYNTSCTIDFTQIGNLINVQKNWKTDFVK